MLLGAAGIDESLRPAQYEYIVFFCSNLFREGLVDEGDCS